MKLSKALKEKKRLAAEIARLKHLIYAKNSYIEGSNVPEKFKVSELYSELQKRVQELVNLKIVINEANHEIQSSIYLLGEYKAMISFLSALNVNEGPQFDRYRNETPVEYGVQFDEIVKNELMKEYQDKADALQDQIDTYNYTTDVAWGDDYDEETEK